MRPEIKKIQEMMEGADYVTDAAIATSVHLAMTLKKPLLIEGNAGVGKTEVAKVMARMLGTNLIRLQCYEGLDAAQALYEWNYPKQLLHIKLEESTSHSLTEKEAAIFSPPFLIKRPLLQAISETGTPPVLLIDEIDRADEEFEAFLLEVLSDFQVTIPEIGTIKATQPPYVILTSNRVRELSDALRRRCLYLWIDFPGFEKEVRIVTRKVPGVNERLAREISRFMETVRTIRLAKVPGVAETLDWAQALTSLHADHREEEPPTGGIEGAQQKQAQVALEDWDEGEAQEGEPLEVPGQSDREVLMEHDFSTFPVEQLDEVARLTVQIAKRLARRVSRRRKPTRRGGVVDLRRSMRANLTRGEIIELRRRSRRRRKVRLVLLCDVSGSMDLYSRFLLQFLYALQNVFGRVETFTFSTRLTRVTEHLKGASYRTALARLTEVRDFSGGTRIGESLQEFNARWGNLVNRHTIVLLLSDGWDTGEPDILANEMLTIKRKAGRLIWLNPLLGNPSYEPLTRGMAAALPLVDHFAAAHNLASLRDLAGHLNLR